MSGSTQTTPQIDDADSGSLEGVLRALQKLVAINTDDCLPATVISYNRTSNRASVQPQVKMVLSDGTLKSRGPIASVPMLQYGGGGFVVSVPAVSGTRGWIKASDRDISLYLQGMQENPPNTQRMHSFSDGFFIPDVLGGYVINGEDAANLTIQTMDGTVRVAIWPNQVKITAPGGNAIIGQTDIVLTTPGGTATMSSTLINFTTPLFQVASPAIHFTSSPVIGAL